MSTPAVNMFAPDGTVRSVASDQLQEALKNGGEVAHKFKAPDGSMRFVPTSKFAQALKNGGIPAQADQSQPTQFERDRVSAVGLSPVQRDIAHAGNRPAPDLSGLEPTVEGNFVPRGTTASALPEAAVNNLTGTGAGTIGAGVGNVSQGNISRGTHQVISGGLDTASPLLPAALSKAPLTTALGVLFGAGGSQVGSTGAKLLGATPDQQNLAGDITGLAAGLGGAKLGSLESVKPLVKAQTVERIVNAVNPAAEDVPKFKSDLNDHLDSVINYAKDSGVPLRNVADFANAAAGAGRQAHDFYMDKMVKPIEQDSIPVPAQSQAGRQVGEYAGRREATVGQIIQRLSVINDTLYPKYQKGGLAAQAAVGADPQALSAEGAGLRDVLNQYMSKKLDIPVDQVAGIRQKMGALRQMGEDVQYYSDQTQRGINTIANNPIRGDAKLPAYALQQGQIAYRNKFGTPADKSLSGAIARYKAGPTESLNPTVIKSLEAPTRTPERVNLGVQPTSPSDVTGGVSTVDPAQQLDQMLGNRINRTNQAALAKREAQAAKELTRAKNASQHGNYF